MVSCTPTGKKIAVDKLCVAVKDALHKTIHPHPRTGESSGIAAEVAHNSCTDVQMYIQRARELRVKSGSTAFK